MNNATVQLRVDSKTKRAVANIFQSLGLDLSSGVKMYFQQVIRHKGVPFPVLTENGYTPAQEKQILAEFKQTLADHKARRLKGYSSVRAMRKDILSP